MNRKKWIVLAVAALVALGALYVYYGYLYKEGRNISSEEASYAFPADSLSGAYAANMAAADGRFLNKTVEVSGVVTEVRDSVIVIDSTIVCSFDIKPAAGTQGKNLTIKGRCIGFDELFGEVKLDQCTIKE